MKDSQDMGVTGHERPFLYQQENMQCMYAGNGIRKHESLFFFLLFFAAFLALQPESLSVLCLFVFCGHGAGKPEPVL